MSRSQEETNRSMLRVRDTIDRDCAADLDLQALAAVAHVSTSHLVRSFAAVFGETPHRYLQRRRIQRAMVLLRDTDASVTQVCFAVGFSSLGTFSRTFRTVVGEPPSSYRARGRFPPAPGCFTTAWTRPSDFGEAPGRGARLPSTS